MRFPPKNLYEQMNPFDRTILATMLGFHVAEWELGDHSGFAVNLQEIPCLPAGWTFGDATKAYCNYLLTRV